MQKNFIKNFDSLAVNENRRLALYIMEAGLRAISTEEVVGSCVSLSQDLLKIKEKEFDLKNFKKIKIVGFGKSSGVAALSLEKILGSRITEGAVISTTEVATKYIKSFIGTHPKPSMQNVQAGEEIYKILENSSEEDLVIVLASGGGSALLCYGEEEYKNGERLYDAFLGKGRTISEMNTVRKHLSVLKGGGIAKLAYPATVVGLIFSDVPGDNFSDVASGPTYKDLTTIEDAEKIIKENNLGGFSLIETPKEDKYFENVHNFVLVSNRTAVEKMNEKAKEMGFETEIISTDLYDETEESLNKIFSAKGENKIILAAGEPKISVGGGAGKGGRNLHIGLLSMVRGLVDKNSVFISFASDGIDNSDMAGGVADYVTIDNAENKKIDMKYFLDRFDSYNFFMETESLINTGPTGANVSDLMILLTKK